MIRQTDGVGIFTETLGEKGSRVLLLHGWGCDSRLMKPLGEKLQSGHRVMLIDFPAHGQSGRPPEPWGVPEYAENLTHLLRETGFYPCAVIAHSFGCRVAAWIATHDPELFTRMIFTGAAGIRAPQSEEGRKRAEAYQRWKKAGQALEKTGVLAPLAGLVRKKAQERYGSRDYNALDDEMKKTFVRVVSQDLSELYPQIRQSTLLIWGDQDTETPLWMGREMEKKIPDAGLVELRGGTHFAYLEQLDYFALIARNFLDEGEGQGEAQGETRREDKCEEKGEKEDERR